MQEKKVLGRHKLIRKKRNRRRLFSLLILVLMLVYLPALWNWLFSPNIEIGVVKTADLEIKTSLKGVFVRKEQLLSSPGDGIILPEAQYGDKVAVNQALACYVNSDMRDVVDNYKEMRFEILKRVVSQYENSSGPERDAWEEAIVNQIAKLTDYANSGNYSTVDSVRDSIDGVLQARAQYMLDNTDAQSVYNNDKVELDRLKNNIEKSETLLSSPISGIISYFCSGDENEWLPENRNTITVEAVDRTVGKETSSQKWITSAEINVKSGQNYGRLVTNDEAWLAFYIPDDQAKQVSIQYEKCKLDNRPLALEVELNGVNKRIPVEIEGFGENTGDYTVIIARMTQFIELTMDMRGVTGSLYLKSVSGMKVPMVSLFNKNDVDQTADVVIVDMNKAVFKRVHIVAEQDSYAIIDNLEGIPEEEQVNNFDIYIVNPRNIEEGQVIDQ